MKRILQVFLKQSDCYGGIESFIDSIYFVINKNKCQFDYLFVNQKCTFREAEIKRLGGNIYWIPLEYTNSFEKLFKYYKALQSFCKTHHYDAVHINNGSPIFLLVMSMAAQKENRGGNIIVHAHSAQQLSAYRFPVMAVLSKELLRYTADAYLACSRLAAERVLPKKIYRQEKYIPIKNAIDVTKFSYNPQVREDVRKRMDLENCFVIGHVGRFSSEKNHEFLIRLFYDIYQRDDSARLVLVGEGPLFCDIQGMIEKLALSKCVLLLGPRDDVGDLYQAMDVFVLPSVYEGLPVVGVEAQVAGLPMVVSDSITRELDFTSNVQYISLHEEKDKWIQAVYRRDRGRKTYLNEAIKAGFDIHDVANLLCTIYESVNQNL